jgi:hypothetical protein
MRLQDREEEERQAAITGRLLIAIGVLLGLLVLLLLRRGFLYLA